MQFLPPLQQAAPTGDLENTPEVNYQASKDAMLVGIHVAR